MNLCEKDEKLYRLRLGSTVEVGDPNDIPWSNHYFKIEIPDKFGGTIVVSRSDNGEILAYSCFSDQPICQGQGRVEFTQTPLENYERNKLIFRIRMKDLEQSSTVSVHHYQNFQLTHRPWNYYFFTLVKEGSMEQPPPHNLTRPAVPILEKYDELTDTDKSAVEWEKQFHISGVGAHGHCEQMAIASCYFPVPDQGLIDNSKRKNNWSFKKFFEIQLLWAEWVSRRLRLYIESKVLGMTTVDLYVCDNEPKDDENNDSSLVINSESNEKDRKEYQRHRILQRYIGKGIPIVIDTRTSGVIPFNAAVYRYYYEYEEVIEDVFKVKSMIVTNYDFGAEPPYNPDKPTNEELSDETQPYEYFAKEPTNEYFIDKMNNWCACYLCEANMWFKKGLCERWPYTEKWIKYYRSRHSLNMRASRVDEYCQYTELSGQSWKSVMELMDTKNTKKIVQVQDNPIVKLWKPKKNQFIKKGDLDDDNTPKEMPGVSYPVGNIKVTKANLKKLNLWCPHPKIDEIVNEEPYD